MSDKDQKIAALRIQTLQDEIASNNQYLPVFCVLFGFFCCLFIIGAIIGIPLILYGIWAGENRKQRCVTLQREIDILNITVADEGANP